MKVDEPRNEMGQEDKNRDQDGDRAHIKVADSVDDTCSKRHVGQEAIADGQGGSII